jgi:hypothetical protein
MRKKGFAICFNTAELIRNDSSILIQSVDISTKEFEHEVLFAYDPATSGAEMVENSTALLTLKDCNLMNPIEKESFINKYSGFRSFLMEHWVKGE